MPALSLGTGGVTHSFLEPGGHPLPPCRRLLQPHPARAVYVSICIWGVPPFHSRCHPECGPWVGRAWPQPAPGRGQSGVTEAGR